jgi:hypothetical protein
MNFEVNGIPYFLTFDTSEAQWFLLTPSRNGVEAMEIHDDGALLADEVPHAPGKSGERRLN